MGLLDGYWTKDEQAKLPGLLRGLLGFTEGTAQNVQGAAQTYLDPVGTGQGLLGMAKQVAADPVGTVKSGLLAARQRVGEAMQSPESAGMLASAFVSPGTVRGLLQPHVRDIVSPEQARTLNTQLRMPDHPEFAQAVANTPGAQITPEGLVMKVARRQLPEQEAAQSVRTGVFYLPAGDKRMSYYTGKTGYGGTDKFEGDTLLKSPLFVKGATGGKAPEAAFDTLNGKGAYETMRRDVLNATRGYGVPRDQKIQQVMDVLEKYGANPDDAYNIVASSTNGNTLPYAIQENIVAHAVRKAGHDGVVGYTKTKSGPVLSELFDVRELTYPSNAFPPEIHDAFTGGR